MRLINIYLSYIRFLGIRASPSYSTVGLFGVILDMVNGVVVGTRSELERLILDGDALLVNGLPTTAEHGNDMTKVRYKDRHHSLAP